MLFLLRIVSFMFRLHRHPFAVVLPAMMLLSGCDTLRGWAGPSSEPLPPVVEPAPPSAVPADAMPQRPVPVPARKPQPAPAAVAAPIPGPEPQRAPAVTGLNRLSLIQVYGLPVAEREAPPARVMEFGIGDCRLAAYLYFDTARNDFYTLHYDVNGVPTPTPDADRCLNRISRDASRR